MTLRANAIQGCFIRSLDWGWRTHSKVAQPHNCQVGAGFWLVLPYFICIEFPEGPDCTAAGFLPQRANQGTKAKATIPSPRSHAGTSSVFYQSHRPVPNLHSLEQCWLRHLHSFTDTLADFADGVKR